MTFGIVNLWDYVIEKREGRKMSLMREKSGGVG